MLAGQVETSVYFPHFVVKFHIDQKCGNSKFRLSILSYPTSQVKCRPHLNYQLKINEHQSSCAGINPCFLLICVQVLHKAVIEVNEKGTTAAAATSVGITPYSMPESFFINRPFFLFIYHEATNSLLFMGRVIDPTKK